MSVKTYKTSFGKFSVVTDTDIYNNLSTADDAETLIPWTLIHGTLAVGSSSYKAEVYNAFASKLASVQLTKIIAAPETEIVYYALQDNKRIRMAYSYYQTPPDIRYISAFELSQDYVSASNGNTPYGVFTTQRSATLVPDYISFEVLVSNDDMTEFKSAVMIVDNDGIITYGITQLSSSDVSISVNDFLSEYFNGVAPIDESEDPYEEGGTSGTGGGTGTFSGTGDAIAIPALPTLSATDAGFITLFNPTASQMAQLANYMWTNPLFDLENWRKIFADPMDAILGLSIVPVNVPSGGAREVKVGNISTGISMTVASSQYVEVDCGTLNVEEFWGAYLDYEPYTTAEIYLPYCGTHAIKVDDIMGKSVHVVYHVDVLSGGCCCYVQCGGTVLYTFLGHCSVSIPITGDNWTRVVNGAIQIAGSVGTMVATGGASFGTGIPNIASAAANLVKPAIEKSGAMGGPGGILAVQTPYLILTRPRQALPAGQNTFTGYPSFITETLGSLTGYTKVFSVHLEDIPATDSEITEIENLLKGGVIF